MTAQKYLILDSLTRPDDGVSEVSGHCHYCFLLSA